MTDLRQKPWNKFSAFDMAPGDRISCNFQFYELIKSETATRHNITNMPVYDGATQNLVYLCRNVLQPVRDHFGPISPNSVYRCQQLERALKHRPSNWISASQHTKGQACDIEVPGVSTVDLAYWIKDNIEFDQLILEYYDPKLGPNSGWVHVSVKPPGVGTNRNAAMYIGENGMYQSGLPVR